MATPDDDGPYRTRDWVFTENIDDESQRMTELPQKTRYLRYSLERGGNTHHLHMQGYLVMDRAMTFAGMKKINARAHFEKMRGTYEQNDTYTGKDDTHVAGPFEFGVRPQQGHRNDLSRAVAAVTANVPIHRIIQEDPGLVRYINHLERYRACLPRRFPDPLAEMELWPYQLQVMDILSGPPVDRRIIWVWSSEYATGKTKLVNKIVATYHTVMGDPADGRNTAFKLNDSTQVVVFALERDYSFADPHSLTRQLEQYSDGGVIPSSKYEPVDKYFRGHCMCVCNHEPLARFRDRIFEIKAERP